LSLEWAWSRSRDVFNFWEISDNSKTVQERLIVSITVEQEVICALSNGYVADDLE